MSAKQQITKMTTREILNAPKQQITKMTTREILNAPAESRSGTVFDVPLNYQPERLVAPKAPWAKFIPTFSMPPQAGRRPTQQPKQVLDGKHRAITVESNGKKDFKIIVEISFKPESPLSVFRVNGEGDLSVNYSLLGALKQYKETTNHVTVTIFYQHVDKQTEQLKHAQTLYINKLVNILKDFRISLLKVAISTQTGKQEFGQTKDFSCFYRLEVPLREFWLSIKDGKEYKQISMTSSLARRIEGVVKAKANRSTAEKAGDTTPFVTSGELVLSHCDLWPRNILVDLKTERVTAIIDWESAGFYPDFYEYCSYRMTKMYQEIEPEFENRWLSMFKTRNNYVLEDSEKLVQDSIKARWAKNSGS